MYAYRNHWATGSDHKLLENVGDGFILAGGEPVNNPIVYHISRMIYALLKWIYPFYKHDFIADRSSYFLYTKAVKLKAHLYIAHTLGALPVAGLAALKNRSGYAFDAEDFHRNELSDDTSSEAFRISKTIEDKWIPNTVYFSASSPLIAKAYRALYDKKVSVILNVFPKVSIVQKRSSADNRRLFWFSQTIGTGRGLENVLQAMSMLRNPPPELHLLGHAHQQAKDQIIQLSISLGIDPGLIVFHSPVAPDDILPFAGQFDIGLSCETGVPYNRDICLTNKLFTYIQAGLAIIGSDTSAQQKFVEDEPGICLLYDKTSPRDLARCIDTYLSDPALMEAHKSHNRSVAATRYNWDIEKEKFLNLLTF